MTPRFLIDRGTATLGAALIARLDGTWRLLESAAFPASIGLEAALAFVAHRAAGVGETLPEIAGPIDRWPDWERIESVSVPPRRIALAAASGRRLAEVEAAATQAGWHVTARITPERTDALAASRALADVRLDALALAAGELPGSDEREAVADLAALAGAIVSRRDDLNAILCGGAVEHADRFPVERVVFAPAPPAADASMGANELARLLMALGGQPGGARLAAAKTASTLAALLERTVELVDVGASGGAWFRAVPPAPDRDFDAAGESTIGNGSLGMSGDETLEGFLLAAGSIVPDGGADGDADLDAVIAWSPLRVDRPTHHDRLRDLRAHPWHDAAGEGTLLRVAAARAALARLEVERARLGGVPAERTGAPDLLVIAGGAFALAPGAAVALAATDTIRRPGMMQLAYDHARLLGPLGTLGAAERLTLVADLVDDLLLPLGSALVLDGGRPGREVARLRVAGDGTTTEPQALAGGTLRLVELAAGSSASVEVEVRDGRLGRTRARRVGFQATGGLGGLLVDTRGIPLRLPQRSERRREVLGQWQRSLWPGAE